MGTLSTPIAESYKFTDFIMGLVLPDLTNDDAVTRARGDEGASISWIVGHLLHYRHELLAMLGRPRDNPFAELFGGNASASDGKGYPTIEQLRGAWQNVSAVTIETLQNTSDEQVTAPMGRGGGAHGEKRVLDTLVFFMWHESYHMGQLGTIRKQLGYAATADLATTATTGG